MMTAEGTSQTLPEVRARDPDDPMPGLPGCHRLVHPRPFSWKTETQRFYSPTKEAGRLRMAKQRQGKASKGP